MTSVRKKSKRKGKGNGGKKRNDAHSSKKLINTLDKELRAKFKYDPRGPNVASHGLQSVVVNPSLPFVVPVDPNIFGGIIMAAISVGVSRGWSLNTFDDNYIYFAWRYQSELLIQAAKGAVPYTGNVPRWVNLLVQAVIKTTVPYRGGEASYAMSITDTFGGDFEQLIGPPAYKHVYSMGVKGTGNVNGLFPIINNPAAYTTELGEQASQSFWLFLQASGKNAEMHKMEPFNSPNCMTNDVSAFAWFQNTPGGGFANSGAWFKTLYHEVDIKRPMYGVFSPAPADLPFNRAQVKMRIGSGDAITLGGLLTDGFDEKQMSVKTQIVPKFIDFLQFADQYARAIRQALTLRTQTATFIENVGNNTNYFVENVQCPLTFQEFQILLKATCMLVYTDTIKYQGIYPRTASGPTDNEFVAYPCGIQSAPIPYGNMMMMPQLLQENILACGSRQVIVGKAGEYNPVCNYAVLGQYNSDRLDCGDYAVTYTYKDEEFTVCPFADSEGEVEISLIDGYYSMMPDGICAINDPAALVKLAAQFNVWIAEQGDHFRMLNAISTDSGVNALAQSGMTMHWRTLPQKTKPVKSKKKKKRDAEALKKPVSRFSRKSAVAPPTGVYAQREMIALSVGYELFDTCWTQFQQYWVQAVNRIDLPTGPGDNTGYLRMAAFMREPRQLSLGTGSHQFSTIAERNQASAALMVKTKFAQPTAQEAMLRHLMEDGEGGVLGELGSAVVGTLGHPGVDVATQLLKRLPW